MFIIFYGFFKIFGGRCLFFLGGRCGKRGLEGWREKKVGMYGVGFLISVLLIVGVG